MQALPALPESLCVVEMGGATEVDTGLISVGGMFLNIGLQNGVLLRTALDSVTGDLSDTRTRFSSPLTNTSALLTIFIGQVSWNAACETVSCSYARHGGCAGSIQQNMAQLFLPEQVSSHSSLLRCARVCFRILL